MASPAMSTGEPTLAPPSMENREQFIRVIVADSQAIFRAGLRKIFAVEDDIRVVGQAETLQQAVAAAKKFSAEIVIFEAALAERPADAVQDILKQASGLRVVAVTEAPDQELTLELLRRGAHAVVSREVDSELFVECLRKVATGEAWVEPHAMKWVLDAYRTQGTRPQTSRTKVQLTPKEALIVSCVTQGMKNKEIAQRVGTTEQVVKNYLRKVYDKLGVADRLELALYCLNSRVLQDAKQAAPAEPQSAAPHAPQAPQAPEGRDQTTSEVVGDPVAEKKNS
ncbi:MAG TPA: response regulator transcription factor [Terriglobales bacterium]|jgi:DNA-binding NarL/FixJ family response regulator|nr:response regulator transcription factor [Terriglobales bacterium]